MSELVLNNGGEQGVSSRVEGGCETAARGGGVPVTVGGDVSVWRPVSREVMERELVRWKGVLDRLGDVDAGGVSASSQRPVSRELIGQGEG